MRQAWSRLQKEARQCAEYLETESWVIMSAAVYGIGGNTTDGSIRIEIVKFLESQHMKVVQKSLS